MMKLSTSHFSASNKITFAVILLLFTILYAQTTVVVLAQETFACDSICTDDSGKVVTNPDQSITYDWNSRVPVPSSTVGETVQTFTCAEFDVRLTSFDESDCIKHQQGLQAAGCTCGDPSSAFKAKQTMGILFVLMTCLVVCNATILWL